MSLEPGNRLSVTNIALVGSHSRLCCNAGATSTLGVHGEAPGAGPGESTFMVEIDDLRTGHLLMHV